MSKLLTKTKNIVIFILLLTIFPLTFVEGFMAYLHHVSDDEELKLLNQTYDIFYKICLNSAYISLMLTYIVTYFITKIKNIKLWIKLLLISMTYIILFIVFIFTIIFISQ